MPAARRTQTLIRRLVAAGSVTTIALICLFVFGAWQVAKKDYERNRQAAGNVLATMSLDIARSFESYSLSLDAVAESFPDQEVMALDDRIKRLVLFDRAATQGDLGSIFVLDATGHLAIESKPGSIKEKDHSARDYFRTHLQDTDNVHVSLPWATPQGEQWIALSRRIEDKKDEFAGVVVGTMKLSYFRNLLQSIPRQPGQTITISYEDGTTLMAVPYLDAQIARNIRDSTGLTSSQLDHNGTYDAVSATDGVRRMYAVAKVPSYPLVLTYGVSFGEIFGHWVWQTAILGIGLLALCVTNMLLLVLLVKELHKRGTAEKRLETLASTDALTGIANRRTFDSTLSELWARALIQGTPLAAIMIDVDHFKRFNDSNGHLMGDLALRTVADCISDCVGARDLLARYGGEEFAILMPGKTLSQAQDIAARIRSRVLGERRKGAGGSLAIPTVSIGVASMVPQGPQCHVLLNMADMALLSAKEQGRNRVHANSLDLSTTKSAA